MSTFLEQRLYVVERKMPLFFFEEGLPLEMFKQPKEDHTEESNLSDIEVTLDTEENIPVKAINKWYTSHQKGKLDSEA